MAEEEIQETGTEDPHGETDQTDWKAESRKWETRSKENMKLAESLQKSLDESADKLAKVEAERQAALDELASMRNRQQLDAARMAVSAETGVPANLISGKDEDEMREHAKGILEYARPAAPKVPGAGSFDHEPDPADAKARLAKQIFGKQ